MVDNHRKLKQRSKLGEVLPLETPFVVHIDVASACNFKCNFCFHSLSSEKLAETGFVPRVMDFDLFCLAIDKMKEFPSKLKRLCLIRHGEALLNPKLPEMIEYAKKSGIAEQINISSNGSLLTPEMSDRLIKTGLDEILISVEALSNHGYKDICGIEIDFEKFVSNIEYFNKNKKTCKLYVKIVDCSLQAGDKQKFHEIFDRICDRASIEYIIPCFSGVDYPEVQKVRDVNIIGEPWVEILTCPQPFFQMHIFPNGNISVCNADYNEKLIFGNVQEDSLFEVWKGKKWNEFRTMHLCGERLAHEYCKQCASNVCYSSASDILDNYAEDLIKHYK